MKKVTKTQIVKVLRSENVTDIFKIAKLKGVDVSDRGNVYKFIQENAPSDKVYNKAYQLSYAAGNFKVSRAKHTSIKAPIAAAIQNAKYHKNSTKGTNYFKVLIVGNSNIYWANPWHKHADYNKSVAFENTEANRNFAKKLNSFLGFQA